MSTAAQSLVWKPEYAVGDATIDEQHRQLFALAGELMRADEQAALAAAVDALHRYVCVHFKHEEGLMRRIGYPHYREHAAMHDELMERISALSVDIHAGLRRSEGLRAFMDDWLLGHIVAHDTRLASWVRASAR